MAAMSAERQPLSDDEFDRLQALYDALYRVFTPASNAISMI